MDDGTGSAYYHTFRRIEERLDRDLHREPRQLRRNADAGVLQPPVRVGGGGDR